MREVDFDQLSVEDLLDYSSISKAFKKYLVDTLKYDEAEADFVIATDFLNPYATPFIIQEYEGDCTINDSDYEVRRCHTNFSVCDLIHLHEMPSFEFFMLIDLDTLSDDTICSYQEAKKLYYI